jgi:hypothetical protein
MLLLPDAPSTTLLKLSSSSMLHSTVTAKAAHRLAVVRCLPPATAGFPASLRYGEKERQQYASSTGSKAYRQHSKADSRQAYASILHYAVG